MKPNVIIRSRKVPVDMPPYNWRELGLIKNVDECSQGDFYNKRIYQILSLRYFAKILMKKQVRFMNIARYWQDPYELFLLKYDITVDGRPYKEEMSRMYTRYYGQCWSMTRDSDAMWRIYSHDRGSVRIKTTVGKVIEVLNQTRGMISVVPLFGKVQYLNKEEISEWLKTYLNGGSGQLYFAFGESLFIKRSEFAHENEMRFVLYVDEYLASKFDGKKYKSDKVHEEFIDLKVEPFDFIEEIALDPRLSAEDFSDWKSMLSIISGNIPIVQSDLYEFQSVSIPLKKTPMHITCLQE